jgi:hypothetical protein
MLSIQKLRLLSLPLRREEEEFLQESTSSILGLKTGYDQGKGKRKKNNPKVLASFGLTPKSYVSCTKILNLSFKHFSFHSSKKKIINFLFVYFHFLQYF